MYCTFIRLKLRARHTRLVALLIVFVLPAAFAGQDALEMSVNQWGERTLDYDWPILSVGTGEYPQGPTGVTVFQFDEKVKVAVDARGGGPGTVNAEYIQLGYDLPELDTIVFAGGSWYGLEAVTAVATALKDDGIRDGNAFAIEPNIALSTGSIIFDFGRRRLNEIYPDKRLAQAAFRAAQTGTYPLGAYGAGRFAKTGGILGCNAFSGQGGAYEDFGGIKIAAFVVVNALGVVTDREGNTVACYGRDNWPENPKTADLLARYVSSERDASDPAQEKNTTISLIVTNQKLSPAELQRLASQVHTSMARAIQPFATILDGDVLYAVSTGELEGDGMSSAKLGTVASEVMWDAILSSVPEQPQAPRATESPGLSAAELEKLEGRYRFSEFAELSVRREGRHLYARATGKRRIYAVEREEDVKLLPVNETDFMIPGRYPLVFRFAGSDRLVINPGHWQQVGRRQ